MPIRTNSIFFNSVNIAPRVKLVGDFGCRNCEFNYCVEDTPTAHNTNGNAVLCTFKEHYLT